MDEIVIPGAFPAGAVVAAIAQEHVEEGIGIIVIPNPTRSREVVVEARLGAVEDFPFDLP